MSGAGRRDDLHPIPLDVQLTRLAGEWEGSRSLYGIPEKEFFAPDPARDLGLTIHGRRLQTPFGPAAGPHTQLAQNIVSAWLVGCRFMELKTVQVLDRLEIPRPCIDARSLVWNVEWSQELTLAESLREYVTAWLVIQVILAEGWVGAGAGQASDWLPLFDLSVGYDLAGIKSPAIAGFIRGIRDARPLVRELTRGLRGPWSRYRDHAFEPAISRSVTLSTFHGCPKTEIEEIARHLLDEGWHTIVKLNPTQLPRPELEELLQRLGYRDLEIPQKAWDGSIDFGQAASLVRALTEHQRTRGAGSFGIKLTNTLEVVNRGSRLPGATAYLSGRPLHGIAIALAQRFRGVFGEQLPISFSAGIDGENLPDALAAGLAPVTACTELLSGAGYRKLPAWFRNLRGRMAAAGAGDLAGFACRLAGTLDPGRARVANLDAHAARVLVAPRYRRAGQPAGPRKTGEELGFWDCLACDKCVKVCPNGANFAFRVEPGAPPARTYEVVGRELRLREERPLGLAAETQYGNVADACNHCSLCEQFCPQDGAPYLAKPRLFVSRRAFDSDPTRDGVLVGLGPEPATALVRRGGRVYSFRSHPSPACTVDGVELALDPEGRPLRVVAGEPPAGLVYRTEDWVLAERALALVGPGAARDNFVWAAAAAAAAYRE